MKKRKRSSDVELAKDMESNFIDSDNYLTKTVDPANPSLESSVSSGSSSSSRSGSKSKKKSNKDFRLGRS